MPETPNPQPLGMPPLPPGAVTYCSSLTGDCLYFAKSAKPAEPGQAPLIRMGDAGGSFQPHDVKGHELWFFAQNLVAEVQRRGGREAVQAMIAGAHEQFDPEIYDIIQRDLATRLAEKTKQDAGVH